MDKHQTNKHEMITYKYNSAIS